VAPRQLPANRLCTGGDVVARDIWRHGDRHAAQVVVISATIPLML
jgi:hypothetical protein